MISPDELEELRSVCSSARALTDGPLNLVHLSNLNLEANGQLIEVPEALLCLSGHQGYLTRLYLSQVQKMASIGKPKPYWDEAGIHGLGKASRKATARRKYLLNT